MAQTDPYAAYGGHTAPQQAPPASAASDPYAAYGGHAAPTPERRPSESSLVANPNREGVYKMNGPNGPVGIPFSNVPKAKQGGYTLNSADAGRYQKDYDASDVPRITAHDVPWWERAREVLANSAVGHSLEEGLPAVADALHLHPTETVYSPSYQSDRQQLIAPQFFMSGNPRSHLGRVTKGALTGAGKLTSGNNMATTAALAATGGLAAPLAPAATALKVGLTGMGAYGVGRDAYDAGKAYAHGNDAQGDEEVGEALPNVALMLLPHAGKPVERFGEAVQDIGADLMDSYLKAGKKAYRYDADPGRGILEQGPRTSVGFTREGFAQGVDAAKNRVGAKIPSIIDNSTAQIPRATLRGGQDAVLRSKTSVLNGPGGDKSTIPALEDLRSTMSPLVDVPSYASPREVYNAKRNMDENINWGRDMDPKDATVNNTRREMRSNLSGHLYDAVPELAEPSRQYGDLSSAAKLANDRTYDRNGSVFNPFRIASMIEADALTQGTTHNTGLSAGVGLATGILPEVAKLPIVKTGGATALYQLGRGIAATGRGLSRFTTPTGRAGVEDGAQYNEGAQPSEHEGQRFSQGTLSSAPYRLRNLSPEIIRPEVFSRSKIGLGASGRSGTMIRPLGRLPAPPEPISEGTPYSFSRQPIEAVPERSEANLQREIGSRASLVPRRLLEPVTSPGTAAEKAAALRQVRTGSYGNIAPSRLFLGPEGASDVRPRVFAETDSENSGRTGKTRGRKR